MMWQPHDISWMDRDPQECGCDECQDQILREILIEANQSGIEPKIAIKSGLTVRCQFCQSTIMAEQYRVEVRVASQKSWDGGPTFHGVNTYNSHTKCHIGFESLVSSGVYDAICSVVKDRFSEGQ